LVWKYAIWQPCFGTKRTLRKTTILFPCVYCFGAKLEEKEKNFFVCFSWQGSAICGDIFSEVFQHILRTAGDVMPLCMSKSAKNWHSFEIRSRKMKTKVQHS
jgi:hypothetical protein